MKRFRFSFLFVFAAFSIVAIGSAALSSLSFDRSVAGQVLVDTDENVAIQISNISKYDGLVKKDADGKVSFDLNEAINNDTKSGFNTDASFSIGTATSGVIKIKNNSDIPVTVTMNNSSDKKGIALVPTNNSNATIKTGASSDFYFTIDTNDHKALQSLNAVIHIEGK